MTQLTNKASLVHESLLLDGCNKIALDDSNELLHPIIL